MRTIDTATDDLLAVVDEGVATLTMNRPDRRNAMSGAMNQALARALAEVEIADDVGCVVLTGAGGAFCAGGDVKGMASGRDAGGGSAMTYDAGVHRQRLNQRAISQRLFEMPKPTIAALPGAAAGAGLSLALACDLRYAVPTAVLTTAFAKVGFAGDYGGTWFLTRLVGSGKARELYYFSDKLGADEAERLGIVNAVFPEATFADDVAERARRLAVRPDGGVPVHEGEPQPGGARRARRVSRHGGGPSHSHRADRGPSRGSEGVRREAPADVPRSLAPEYGHRGGSGGRGRYQRWRTGSPGSGRGS